MLSEEMFEVTSADGSNSYPVQCSALRKNGYVLIRGQPCKIVEMSTSKTGKHGRAKVNLVGIDIFNGKKYQDMHPSTHSMEVPIITNTDLIVVDVGAEFLSLMEDDGSLRADLRIPNGSLASNLRDKFDNIADDRTLMVSVIKAMGQEMVKSIKLVK